MTAIPAPRPGWVLLAGQVNQRRYEALRACLYEGLSLREAADATGYTRAAVASLVRDLRAGKLTIFAPPGVPGRKSAPKKDAAHGRVIELRRAGLSVYEISTRLTSEGTPLGRSAVSDILREEGFGRLLRGPAPEASTSPATSGRATRRVSHVDDLLLDPAPALLAGLAVLPKKTALTDYSYRLSHDHQQRLLAALDKQMIAGGLAAAEEAVFDLDFHAVMHWGRDPVLEKHYVPTRSQRARSVLTFFAQDSGTHNLVYGNADISKATQARPGPFNRARVHENPAARLTSYPGTVRQLVVTSLGREAPTVIISNDHDTRTRALVEQYARRMTIEQRLAEIIRAFCADALSSTVNLNVDLDIMLAVLAHALLAALRTRLPGYAAATPDTLQRRFPDTRGELIPTGDVITVRLSRRTYSPVLRQADLPPATKVPWWGNRTLRYELA